MQPPISELSVLLVNCNRLVWCEKLQKWKLVFATYITFCTTFRRDDDVNHYHFRESLSLSCYWVLISHLFIGRARPDSASTAAIRCTVGTSLLKRKSVSGKTWNPINYFNLSYYFRRWVSNPSPVQQPFDLAQCTSQPHRTIVMSTNQLGMIR